MIGKNGIKIEERNSQKKKTFIYLFFFFRLEKPKKKHLHDWRGTNRKSGINTESSKPGGISGKNTNRKSKNFPNIINFSTHKAKSARDSKKNK